jgi:hypothetical protein
MNHSINDLRTHLMETLASLRDRESPLDIDRARAIGTVASVLVDTVRVENEYLKLTGGASEFLDPREDATPRIGNAPSANNPFPASVRHRLEG